MFQQSIDSRVTRSVWSQFSGAGVLVAEAAIATIVFSVFASASPHVFGARPASARPATAHQASVSSQNKSAIAIQFPTYPAAQTAN
jgi:hypothetical protein